MITDVTPDWIRSKLRQSGKTQAELAEFLGWSGPDVVSKTLSGNRSIKVHEAKKILAFFALEGSGLSEDSERFVSKAPQIDTSALLASVKSKPSDAIKNTENDDLNQVRMAIVGDRIQLAGTYNREGIDKLIARLQTAKEMLDD